MTGADRQRRRRERSKLGIDVWSLELPSAEITEALLEAGFVSEDEATDHAACCRALERLILTLFRQYRELS